MPEFVRAKKGWVKLPDGRWKITARYSVQTGDGKYLECVRLRGPGFGVFHFTKSEFERLFTKETG